MSSIIILFALSHLIGIDIKIKKSTGLDGKRLENTFYTILGESSHYITHPYSIYGPVQWIDTALRKVL